MSDCEAETLLADKKINYRSVLNRGWVIHQLELASGVNGLYDMGANVWEWAKLPSVKDIRRLWVDVVVW